MKGDRSIGDYASRLRRATQSAAADSATANTVVEEITNRTTNKEMLVRPGFDVVIKQATGSANSMEVTTRAANRL